MSVTKKKTATSARNPIALQGVFDPMWIFFLYGVALGVTMLYQAFTMKVPDPLVLKLFEEPVSLYGFHIFCLLGMLGLFFYAIVLSRTPSQMLESTLVCRVLVPLVSTGLSTGAAICGVTLGLGSCLLLAEPLHLQGGRTAAGLIAFGLFFGVITLILQTLLRMLLDTTPQEARSTLFVGYSVLALVGVIGAAAGTDELVARAGLLLLALIAALSFVAWWRRGRA